MAMNRPAKQIELNGCATFGSVMIYLPHEGCLIEGNHNAVHDLKRMSTNPSLETS